MAELIKNEKITELGMWKYQKRMDISLLSNPLQLYNI